MEKIWLKFYPTDMPVEIKTDVYPSLVHLMDVSFASHRALQAYRYLGSSFSFGAIDDASRALAAWFQAQGLQRGDRVAVMLPNMPQYPVAVAAILRAGLVVVNVNPQYTAGELAHQLKDSGAKAIVVLENLAAVFEQVMAQVPTKLVLLAAMGDMLAWGKGLWVNHVVRRVKHQVPDYALPGATRFTDALARGRRMRLARPALGPDDIAMLQYTGGTTGMSKGAVLLHRNLMANVLQSQAWNLPALEKLPPGEQLVTVCALPLHHVFGFNINMMLGLHQGACNILIPDADDLDALLKALVGERFHSFPAASSLFNALASHRDFGQVDWRHLILSVGGGMAVSASTARLWFEKTGCPICEGYGLTETSPSATCNPVNALSWSGNIGLPLPGTEVQLLDDDGRPVPVGMAGEITIRGPQVMAGYWQRPDETAKAMTADGFFRTGDVGIMDERGYLRIVDRKNDMILVGGFNVYPNEVEDLLLQLPGVLECAAVGQLDDKSGEVVRVVIVKNDPLLTESDVRAYCETRLSGYKRPRVVEFRSSLPRSAVGKVLRRELRDARR